MSICNLDHTHRTRPRPVATDTCCVAGNTARTQRGARGERFHRVSLHTFAFGVSGPRGRSARPLHHMPAPHMPRSPSWLRILSRRWPRPTTHPRSRRRVPARQASGPQDVATTERSRSRAHAPRAAPTITRCVPPSRSAHAARRVRAPCPRGRASPTPQHHTSAANPREREREGGAPPPHGAIDGAARTPTHSSRSSGHGRSSSQAARRLRLRRRRRLRVRGGGEAVLP